MTTPAMRALKELGPGVRMTLLTSRAGAEVAGLIPEVDTVIVYDAPWLKSSPTASPRDGCAAMADRLRSERFDAAVIFTVYSQSALPAALLCHMAGIPRRLAHCRENPYQLLTDWVPEPEPERIVRHECRRQLDLVATVGCAPADEAMSLRVPRAARARARALVADLGLGARGRWAVVHPGATAPSRRYPQESFAAAARRLVSAGCAVVFTGSEAEAALVEGIRAAMEAPSHSLAGRLTLAELAALLEAAPLLISNNTGPVHVAAAVGTPVVDLYALTNPQHTPWGVASRVLSHDVACKWCYRSVCPEGHHNCLRLVAPDEVFAAACDLLQWDVERGAAAET